MNKSSNKKNMKRNNSLFRIFYGSNNKLSTMLLASIATLSVVSCADNDLLNGNENADKDVRVSFNVNDVQTRAIENGGGSITRGAVNSNIASADLKTQKLAINGAAGANLCFIETTVEGVNPVQGNAQTRANVVTTIASNFSASGHRGVTEATITDKPEWFYNKETQSNGKLTEYIPWSWDKQYGRFYAVYPQVTPSYSKIKLSPDTYAGNPYIEFEVEKNVKDQKDLMTACTGNVHYATRGTAPTTNLDFRHALTAIKFAVGQNLSWNKTISKVEIVGALSKGKYTLSDKLDGTGAAWDATSLSTPETFTLDGLSVVTSENPNNVIVGKTGDNYTFYMIPQTLTGKNIKAYVYFTDGSKIESTLTGSWVAGTTKTYKLSEKNSTWDYTLNVVGNLTANYDQTSVSNYRIESYRTAPDGVTKQAVKWKVIGYEEYDDATGTWNDLGMTKPSWLTALSAESGAGGTSAQYGLVTLKKGELVDKLTSYNKVLQEATPKGSAGNYYNLSNATGAAQIENTANSYLISAPGYYRIPLVYGNAIKNSADNPSSYKTSNTGAGLLSHFKDHLGNNINSPYINVQNASKQANKAKIVWTDQKDIVENLSVVGNGNTSFLQFHVPADKIKNGNAVIAVTDDDGTVMWSWHLWFDHSDVLNTIAVTNKTPKTYYFSTRPLGYADFKWEETTYKRPRQARVKVEQEIANNGLKQQGSFTITQKTYTDKVYGSTLYQWGRKDAMPGINDIKDGFIVENGGNNMSLKNGIQHPEIFYTHGNSWFINYNELYNLWSMENRQSDIIIDQNPVKTIYDPNPVGFVVPANKVWDNFIKSGNGSHREDLNVIGEFDNGWHFRVNGTSSSTQAIFFPASGYRLANDGTFNYRGYRGEYWSSLPEGTAFGYCLEFYNNPSQNISEVSTRSYAVAACGLAIFPVKE